MADLLALDSNYPQIFFSNPGNLTYVPGSQFLTEAATPFTIKRSASVNDPARTIKPTTDPKNPGGPLLKTMQIKIAVNESGQLIGGTTGEDLLIYGQVDLDGNGTLDAYDGPLLTGEIVEFGFQDGASNVTDKFEFRFKITGGTLVDYGLYDLSRDDLFVNMVSEGSSFSNDFTRAFTGNAKGNVWSTPTTGLGDRAWEDLNGNGIQDGDEPSLPGVRVDLYDNANLLVATATTDYKGDYLFTGLKPGGYHAQFTPPVGYLPTAVKMGGNVAQDNDAGPDGMTDPFTLPSGVVNRDLDGGFSRPGTIANKVWHDLNGNGIREAGEPLLAGVTVTLLNQLTGLPVGTASTDGNGDYQFTNLAPGQYLVQVPTAGYRVSPVGQGSDASSDSNIDNGGMTPVLTLLSGGTVTHVDAGLYTPVVVSGKVWADQNANGLQESGENGVDNLLVTLLGGNGQPLATTLTANGGSYTFADLFPGTYSVLFAKGINTFTVTKVGGDATIDSDANVAIGQTDAYLLSSGEAQGHLDAGLILAQPLVTIVTSTNGDDADLAPGPAVVVGNSVTWTYLVTNSGPVELRNVVVTDDRLAGPVCTIPLLALGASTTCTVPGTSVRGQYENNGSVTGEGNGLLATATNPSHYLGVQPAIDIEKYVSTNGGAWVDADSEAEALLVPSCSDAVVAASGQECSGSVTELSFAYHGQEKVDIEVRDKGGKLLYHLEEVDPEQEFTLAPPKDSKGRLLPLPAEIRLYTKGKKATAKNKEWQYHATIHSNCTEPIGPGTEGGDFEVVEGKSSLGGELCKVRKAAADDGRKPCGEKATELSFVYRGGTKKEVKITDEDNRTLFHGQVKPGDKVRVHGQDGDGTLTSAIKISCDGRLHTTIKTDCSVAIGPGKRSGDFEVEEGESRTGGKLCRVDREDNYLASGGGEYEQPVCTASQVSFKFVVKNSGDVPLRNIAVSDSVYPLTNCSPPATLAKDGSFTCTLGPLPAVAGAMQMDIGTATGDYDGKTYQDSDLAYYFVPEPEATLTVVKTASPETVTVPCDGSGTSSSQGDDTSHGVQSGSDEHSSSEESSDNSLATCAPTSVVTYTYLVANRGSDLVEVEVVDDRLGTIATFARLEAGGSRTVSKQACITTTTVNKVTVTGQVAATHQVLQAFGEATVDAVCADGGDATCKDGLIGDRVWNDVNRNGIQDGGENGLAGAIVTLTGTNVYGVAVNPPSATTDGGGAYQFTGLCQGNYKVTVTPPVGYTAAPGNQGADRGLDSNDSPATVLLANDHTADRTIDFGYYLAVSLLGSGDTATIGFWQNRNGQALIKAVSGGASAKNLGNWLASNFPYLFGANAGSNNLTGKSNTEVAALFVNLFAVRGQKTDAQILASALACYVTNTTLAGTTAATYHFNISATGTGAKTYNVGANGTGLGLSNNTAYSVMALLQQVNLQKKNGTFNANAANAVFDGINQLGDIL